MTPPLVRASSARQANSRPSVPCLSPAVAVVLEKR